jgi:hypothetical protein
LGKSHVDFFEFVSGVGDQWVYRAVWGWESSIWERNQGGSTHHCLVTRAYAKDDG